MITPCYDFAIVGAGMAGASLAAQLSDSASILLLEAENQPGYHATGRSAAFWEECYGGPELVPLTLASGPFLSDGGFLRQRGALYIARDEDCARLGEFEQRFSCTQARYEIIGRTQLETHIPGLLARWKHAIWEPNCADIDVAALHAFYLAQARANSVKIVCSAQVRNATFDSGLWQIKTADGRAFRAARLVNAAGAWADDLALLAGVTKIGIQPLLRTVIQLRIDPPARDDLPLVLDIGGKFYFKPQNGRLWLSPHDETPSPASDVAADELAVAEAIDRLHHVVDWQVQAVERKWAGLRSFAADRLPVYGEEPGRLEFVWFAGQGGFGIQTAHAAALLMADHLLGRTRSQAVAGIDDSLYLPDRFR